MARFLHGTQGDKLEVADRSDDYSDLDAGSGKSADGRNLELSPSDGNTGERCGAEVQCNREPDKQHQQRHLRPVEGTPLAVAD